MRAAPTAICALILGVALAALPAVGLAVLMPVRAVGSTGTCFAIDPRGTILTAHHVVDGASTIRVRFSDGRSAEAELRKGSASIDLAVLKAEIATPKFLDLAPRGSARVGDHVFTIGHPAHELLGADAKYSDGSVSALSGRGGDATLIQMSVPVQPGNSGGPLLNDRGQVVGVVTSTAAAIPFFETYGALPQNVNWAVNAEYASPFLGDMHPLRRSAASLSEAIAHAQDAVCFVEATKPTPSTPPTGSIVSHQTDQELYREAAQRSLEYSKIGQTSTWHNPDTGNSGSFTPTQTYQTQSGQYCREYQEEMVVGGQAHKSYGTYCRMSDGRWQLQP